MKIQKGNVLIAISLVLVVALAAGAIGWKYKEVSNQNAPAFEAKGNETMESLEILTYPLGDHNLLFSIEVPTEWRATMDRKASLSTMFPTQNDTLANLSFLSPTHPSEGSNIEPKNTLAFYDASRWITEDEEPDEFGQITTAQDKRSFFSPLIRMRDTKKVEAVHDCMIVWSICRPSGKNYYVESNDGVFSGFAHLHGGNIQVYQYQPTLHVHLAGEIGGKLIYVNGNFELYDQYSKEIEESGYPAPEESSPAIDKALNQIASGSLAPDTQEQVNQILEAIRTIEAKIEKRQNE